MMIQKLNSWLRNAMIRHAMNIQLEYYRVKTSSPDSRCNHTQQYNSVKNNFYCRSASRYVTFHHYYVQTIATTTMKAWLYYGPLVVKRTHFRTKYKLSLELFWIIRRVLCTCGAIGQSQLRCCASLKAILVNKTSSLFEFCMRSICSLLILLPLNKESKRNNNRPKMPSVTCCSSQ